MFPRYTRLLTSSVAIASGILFGLTAAFPADSVAKSAKASTASKSVKVSKAVPIAPEAVVPVATKRSTPCPPGMAMIERTYCIDRWEASLVELTPQGERGFSPFKSVGKTRVRAVSKPGVTPQAYISRVQAANACAAAGKRLCKADEWLLACRGSIPKKFPYGNQRVSGLCNDSGVAPLTVLYSHLGEKRFRAGPMNDPRLNALPGTLAKTGTHERCASEYGVYDMVGNVHEWVDEAKSAFRGGYYLDTHKNGDGCNYRTTAHKPTYHDYSTGFRCCADVAEDAVDVLSTVYEW